MNYYVAGLILALLGWAYTIYNNSRAFKRIKLEKEIERIEAILDILFKDLIKSPKCGSSECLSHISDLHRTYDHLKELGFIGNRRDDCFEKLYRLKKVISKFTDDEQYFDEYELIQSINSYKQALNSLTAKYYRHI